MRKRKQLLKAKRTCSVLGNKYIEIKLTLCMHLYAPEYKTIFWSVGGILGLHPKDNWLPFFQGSKSTTRFLARGGTLWTNLIWMLEFGLLWPYSALCKQSQLLRVLSVPEARMPNPIIFIQHSTGHSQINQERERNNRQQTNKKTGVTGFG